MWTRKYKEKYILAFNQLLFYGGHWFFCIPIVMSVNM